METYRQRVGKGHSSIEKGARCWRGGSGQEIQAFVRQPGEPRTVPGIDGDSTWPAGAHVADEYQRGSQTSDEIYSYTGELDRDADVWFIRARRTIDGAHLRCHLQTPARARPTTTAPDCLAAVAAGGIPARNVFLGDVGEDIAMSLPQTPHGSSGTSSIPNRETASVIVAARMTRAPPMGCLRQRETSTSDQVGK